MGGRPLTQTHHIVPADNTPESTSGLRIHVDQDRCCGHGRCYSLEPALFAPDDEGFTVVLVDPVPREQEAPARRAIDNCPERAISLRD
jgi:ferredoxin